MLDLKPVVHEILKEYPLSRQNIHGVGHWARVWENGLRLAACMRANADVVQLFAIFHDARRVTVKTDPLHGLRGAHFAAKLRGRLFDLSDDDFDLLFVACAGHTDRPTDDDPTVQACWDADRLDLGRAGAKIDPLWLGEATVDDQQEIIEWADRRARDQFLPDLIREDWGVPTDGWKPKAVASTRKAR